MNQSVFRISLDIHSVASQLSFSVNRGDNMRSLIITLTENGKTYEITDDCYAIFTTVKPDGTHIANDCTIQNNTIIYDFTEQTTAVAGKLDCSVIVFNTNNERITSPRFTVIVYETTHQNINLTSESEYTILTKQVADSAQCIEDMNALIETVNEERDSGKYDGASVTGVKCNQTAISQSGHEYSLEFTLSNGETIESDSFIVYRGQNGVDGEKGADGTSIYLVNDGYIIKDNPEKGKTYPFEWEDYMPTGNGIKGDYVIDGLGNLYTVVSDGYTSSVTVKYTGICLKGVGISNAEINEEGELIIYLDDGRTWNAGKVPQLEGVYSAEGAIQLTKPLYIDYGGGDALIKPTSRNTVFELPSESGRLATKKWVKENYGGGGGGSIPSGGTEGQVLTKTGNGAEWKDAPSGSGSNSVKTDYGFYYNEATLRPDHLEFVYHNNDTNDHRMSRYYSSYVKYHDYESERDVDLFWRDVITKEKLEAAFLEKLPLDPSNVTIGKIVSSNYDLSGKTIKVKRFYQKDYFNYYTGKIHFNDGSYLYTNDNYYCSVGYVDSSGEDTQFYHQYLDIDIPFLLPTDISITRLTLEDQYGSEIECSGEEFDNLVDLVLEIS